MYEVPIVRIQLIRDNVTVRVVDKPMSSPAIAAQVVWERIGLADREILLVLHLDAKNRILSMENVHQGGTSSSIVDTKTIFKGAILANADAIIVAHNHPSGDPTPSLDDRAQHIRIKQAGDILGIRVLDHIIVTPDKDKWYSMEMGQ